MECDAVISDCGTYRYLLRRAWNHDQPRALFVMLNPSTADAKIDDPTIRSCIRLCKSWSYGSFEVINLFGLRSTEPNVLLKARSPVGPDNDNIAEGAIGRSDISICAWGAHKVAKRRNRKMWELIIRHRPAAFCLGTTKAGAPKHPLYIKNGTALESYRPGS